MITATLDLRPTLLPIRHQGRRQSCLAFASSTAHEYGAKPGEHLSVEYLFYHAVSRTQDQNPWAGTTMLATSQALATKGQPVESDWPYNFDQSEPWLPPTLTAAPLKATMVCSKFAFDDIVQALDRGSPVILGLIITDGFFRPNGSGLIAEQIPDVERGGHAVLAVGHGFDQLGQPIVLVRNSWGPSWGLEGYGWLTRNYLIRQLHETATLT